MMRIPMMALLMAAMTPTLYGDDLLDQKAEGLHRVLSFERWENNSDLFDDEEEEVETLFNMKDRARRRELILALEETLNAQVFGQEHATAQTADSLIRYFAGVGDKNRPIANFLYLGPTGVGKTELAKVLAEALLGDRHEMLRMDMSEYAIEASAWRIIGSPPGYVNHQQGGVLTNYVRKHPQAIVLLDEIEKAHPEVHKLFLGVLDEGRIKDNRDRWVDCHECIFIMTSNLCSEQILELDMHGLNADEILEQVQGNLIRVLSPELYNRLDPVVFHGLQPNVMHQLVEKFLGIVTETLVSNCGITLTFTEEAIQYLVKHGYDPQLGARPLKRLIDKKIISRLAYEIVKHDYHDGDMLEVDYLGGDFVITYTPPPPPEEEEEGEPSLPLI